jgi:hypothetical protein
MGSQFNKARLTLIATIVVVALALILIGKVQIERALHRAALTEAINTVRSVKFALDGFATDFDGQYPNDETGERVLEGGLGDEYSNDYFRQLFITGETQSETIFWIKGSPVAGKRAPDDKVSKEGKPQADMILQAGDCHWAYVVNQSTTRGTSRPLILDPFLPGTDHFDPEHWNGKAIMLLIDGTIKVSRLNDHHRIVDGSNEDIFSRSAVAWEGDRGESEKLLAQPDLASDKR